MDNVEISMTAVQSRLTALETEIILKDSEIEMLKKRISELESIEK